MIEGDSMAKEMVQSDWYENNPNAAAFIKNKPAIPENLDELGDVEITSPLNGQVLKYNSIERKWKNSNSGGGGGGASELNDLNDVNISSAANNQILIYDENNQVWKNCNNLIATVGNDKVPFRFIYDATTQKYGYLDGADTFHPFNDGGGGASIPAFEVKYNVWADPINYTYTVAESGQYIAFGVKGDGNGNAHCISTTGTEVYHYNGEGARYPEVVIVNCEAGDTIQFSLNNYSSGAYRGTTAGIVKVIGGAITSGVLDYIDKAQDNTKS